MVKSLKMRIATHQLLLTAGLYHAKKSASDWAAPFISRGFVINAINPSFE